MTTPRGRTSRLFPLFNFNFHFLLIFTGLMLTVVANTATASAATLTVAAGGNLQAALNSANCGDIVELQAGATFVGTVAISKQCATNYITIQSSRLAELPQGQRVTPSDAAKMPKIVSPGSGSPALQTTLSASGYRFLGIEFTTQAEATFAYSLIWLGSTFNDQNTLEKMAKNLIFDRCYIHAFSGTQALKRGIDLNSGATDITNSYISGFKAVGQEAQAILGCRGSGPYKIINNYLEGAGENIMFGACDPYIQGMVPSDIEIRRNHFFKPLAWRGKWQVKNQLELKNAQRVTIDGNLFENNWADAQGGTAIVLTPRNQEGTAPWSVVRDVTFTNNIVRHSNNAVSVYGTDDLYPSQRTENIIIRNNVFEDINESWGNGFSTSGFLLISGPKNLTVDHNTVTGLTTIIYIVPSQNPGLVFTNNIVKHQNGGIIGEGVGPGASYTSQATPHTITGNVLVGALVQYWDAAARYPAGNRWPNTYAEVGFVNYSGGNYRLASTSVVKGTGTGGSDPGADIDVLNAAQAGNTIPPPSPTPTPAPTATPTPTPTPAPTATPAPTPTATPAPTPNTNAGRKVRKAKETGQSASNDLASTGVTSPASNSTALEAKRTSIDDLALFISEIQEAQYQFNLDRALYPAAIRIEAELNSTLQSALQANYTYLQNDLPRARNKLRDAINHLELTDVLISFGNIVNPIDVSSYVVRQHYVDFFDREPDRSGNDYWTNQFSACGQDPECFKAQLIHVSAAFFLSIEFQQTGYFVHRLYKSSYGRVPSIVEFMPGNVAIGRGVIVGKAGWEARLADNKEQFLQSWVSGVDFHARYGSLTNDQYVDTLIANLGVAIGSPERDALVQALASGSSRANVLGRLAQNDAFTKNEFNSAFVLMQYFGYLRRDPDMAGFNFWLDKLNRFDGNYQSADMVNAFLTSREYRSRFDF